MAQKTFSQDGGCCCQPCGPRTKTIWWRSPSTKMVTSIEEHEAQGTKIKWQRSLLLWTMRWRERTKQKQHLNPSPLFPRTITNRKQGQNKKLFCPKSRVNAAWLSAPHHPTGALLVAAVPSAVVAGTGVDAGTHGETPTTPQQKWQAAGTGAAAGLCEEKGFRFSWEGCHGWLSWVERAQKNQKEKFRRNVFPSSRNSSYHGNSV